MLCCFGQIFLVALQVPTAPNCRVSIRFTDVKNLSKARVTSVSLMVETSALTTLSPRVSTGLGEPFFQHKHSCRTCILSCRLCSSCCWKCSSCFFLTCMKRHSSSLASRFLHSSSSVGRFFHSLSYMRWNSSSASRFMRCCSSSASLFLCSCSSSGRKRWCICCCLITSVSF